MVAALRPDGPFPCLEMVGEQGTAKSTASRVIIALIDPNADPLRAAPRDERDLAIAAVNRRVLAFDNLSGIPPWLSDAFCRLSTGGAVGTRKLYEDDEEVVFDAKRPVILNGIHHLINRSDLLDRSLCVQPPCCLERVGVPSRVYGRRSSEHARRYSARFFGRSVGH